MRKTTLFFTIASFILCISCKKQINNSDSDIEWSKIFGGSGIDMAYGATETSSGDFIVVGYTTSNDGDIAGSHHCITKTDTDGKTFQDCSNDDSWVLKIDRDGSLLNHNTYGEANGLPFQKTVLSNGYYIPTVFKPTLNSDRFTSIAAPTSGGYYLIAGQTNALLPNYINNPSNYAGSVPYPVNPTNIWVCTADANGKLGRQNIIQDNLFDSATCLKALSDGKFILAGVRDVSKVNGYPLVGVNLIRRPEQGNQYYPTGPIEAFVVKGDTAGSSSRVYLGGTGYDKLNAIEQAPDGGFIAVGQTTSTNGNLTGKTNRGRNDVWAVRLNSDIQPLWHKTYGGENDDIANAVLTLPDGGAIIAGQTNSSDGDASGNHSSNYDAWIMRIDPVGNILWQKTFGGAFGDDMAKSIIKASDGGFIVAGQTSSNDGDVSGNHGYSDAWVFKINVSGELLWQKTLGGSSADGAVNLIATRDGGLLITGYSFSNDGDISRFLANSNYWVVKLRKQ